MKPSYQSQRYNNLHILLLLVELRRKALSEAGYSIKHRTQVLDLELWIVLIHLNLRALKQPPTLRE